jgi:hypothetical protein
MQELQRGVGWFGFLIVVAIAVAVGYYAYKGIWLADEQQPSCEGALNACIRECRRTASEADEEHRCQVACQRDLEACKASGR